MSRITGAQCIETFFSKQPIKTSKKSLRLTHCVRFIKFSSQRRLPLIILRKSAGLSEKLKTYDDTFAVQLTRCCSAHIWGMECANVLMTVLTLVRLFMAPEPDLTVHGICGRFKPHNAVETDVPTQQTCFTGRKADRNLFSYCFPRYFQRRIEMINGMNDSRSKTILGETQNCPQSEERTIQW